MTATRSTAFVISLGMFGALSGLVGATAGSARSGGLQGAQKPQSGNVRAIGTITSIQRNTITLATDAGPQLNVTVQDSTRLLRIAPGQKDLKGATPVRLEELQAGDRILVGGRPSEDRQSVMASSVIVMKHAEIEQKHVQEQAEWQKRGVGGLVSGVDAANQTITLKTRALGGNQMLAIHISKDTILRRYAPGSVKFSDAKPASFDQTKPGDQLRARGTRSANGTELIAQEVVSGSFRNIAGTVSSLDAGANQMTVMDVLTRQPVVVKLTADSQVRSLPPRLAQMIATRLKGGTPAAPGERQRSAPGAAIGRPGEAPAQAPQRSLGAGSRETGAAADLQQVLSRLPAAKLADLQQGEAVMIVSTQGAASGEVTAITVLGGVEPILRASSAETQPMLLSPWSLSAPAGEAASP
jgi:hypothetical protein